MDLVKPAPSSSEPEPLCPALDRPAAIDRDDLHVVQNRIGADRVALLARDKVRRGVLRPDDIHAAEIEPPRLAYVPFWRLELAVDGMHVAVPLSVATKNNRAIPIPLPGYRHRESITLVCARRLFPYPPNHVERTRGVVLGSSTTHGGWHGIEIQPHDMRPLSSLEALEGEVVEPDMTKAEAAHEAGKRVQWDAQPSTAIFASYEHELRAAACCYFPLHVVRYAYEGHAAKHPGEVYWVTVSGLDGNVVGGKHPSAVRSVARKIRKWITFD